MMRAHAWCASLLLAGCSLLANREECLSDADCAALRADVALTCTSDHLCVQGPPAERLCTQGYPAQPPLGAVRVGVLARLQTDELQIKAAQLAVDEMNRYQGAGMTPLALDICDISAAGTTLKSFQVLLRERKVAAVLGPTTSQGTLDLAAAAARARVPLMALASAPELSFLPEQGYSFRTTPSDAVTAAVMAAQVPSGGTLALMTVNNALGKSQRDALVRALRREPEVSVAFTEADEAEGDAALQAVLDYAKLRRMDYVLLLAGLDSAKLVRDLAPLHVSVRVVLTGTAKKPELLTLARDPAMRGHAARLSGIGSAVVQNQTFESFRRSFRELYGRDPLDDDRATHSYDGLYCLGVAIASSAAPVSGAQVAERLRRLRGQGAPVPLGSGGFLRAVQQLRDGDTPSLEGATGTIRFQDNGDREAADFERWRIAYEDSDTPYFVSEPL